MPNIESEITKSNLKIIKESKNQKKNETTCNCRIRRTCPVEGKCLSRRVIYKATVIIITKISIILDLLLETLKQDTTKICIAAEIKIWKNPQNSAHLFRPLSSMKIWLTTMLNGKYSIKLINANRAEYALYVILKNCK